MTLEEYLKSDAFLLFQDEHLRLEACRAVDHFLQKASKPAEKAQLHSIPSVIQAGGSTTLEKLTNKQIAKNTKLENKAFWQFIFDLVFSPDPPDYSLRLIVQKELIDRGFLDDDMSAPTKPQQRQIRRGNKAKVDGVIDRLLPVYFEHFNCHYFYKTH